MKGVKLMATTRDEGEGEGEGEGKETG